MGKTLTLIAEAIYEAEAEISEPEMRRWEDAKERHAVYEILATRAIEKLRDSLNEDLAAILECAFSTETQWREPLTAILDGEA